MIVLYLSALSRLEYRESGAAVGLGRSSASRGHFDLGPGPLEAVP